MSEKNSIMREDGDYLYHLLYLPAGSNDWRSWANPKPFARALI